MSQISKKTNHDQVSCQIRQGAFAGLHSLDQLDLRHNSLERLGAEVFTGELEVVMQILMMVMLMMMVIKLTDSAWISFVMINHKLGSSHL